jgi:hypothetical protein
MILHHHLLVEVYDFALNPSIHDSYSILAIGCDGTTVRCQLMKFINVFNDGEKLFMNCFLKVLSFSEWCISDSPCEHQGHRWLGCNIGKLACFLACYNDCKLAHELEQCRSPSPSLPSSLYLSLSYFMSACLRHLHTRIILISN